MPITNTQLLETTEIFPHILQTGPAFARLPSGHVWKATGNSIGSAMTVS